MRPMKNKMLGLLGLQKMECVSEECLGLGLILTSAELGKSCQFHESVCHVRREDSSAAAGNRRRSLDLQLAIMVEEHHGEMRVWGVEC